MPILLPIHTWVLFVVVQLWVYYIISVCRPHWSLGLSMHFHFIFFPAHFTIGTLWIMLLRRWRMLKGWLHKFNDQILQQMERTSHEISCTSNMYTYTCMYLWFTGRCQYLCLLVFPWLLCAICWSTFPSF